MAGAILGIAAEAGAQSYVEVTPGAASVTASTDDSNVPANSVDNNLRTRWSGSGSGAWIQYDLGAVRTVGYVRVAVYGGNRRRNQFDLQLSSDALAWTTVFTGQSSGATTAEETYEIADANARYVRYLGRGATLATGAASAWNSVTEVSVFALPGGPTPTPTAGPAPTPTLTPTAAPSGNLALGRPAVASSIEGAGLEAAKAVDGSATTRWASLEGADPQWIYVDLGASTALARVVLRWEAAYARSYQVQVSENASAWTTAYSTTAGDGGVDDLAVAGQGRYLRVNGTQRATAYGYSLYELEVYGTSDGVPTPTPGPTPTPRPTPTPGPTPTMTPTPAPTTAPSEVKICILGDSAIGSSSVATHGLCKAAGVDAILHTGDLDYADSPPSWESFITAQVGANFPYFYVLGNHETHNASGYRADAEARFRRLGITWSGTLTSHCSFDWRGIRFIMTTPGIGDGSADTYIRDQAAASSAPWVLSTFHQQMARMQVNTKGDTTGWGVYEEARKQGVLTWNGHAHGYGRTHLLGKMDTQTVADNTSPYTITKGASIVVQTGLGGDSVSSSGPHASQAYWGKVSTSSNGGTYGVVICTFGAAGDPKRADCVFRNTKGVEVDRWTMFSAR